MRFRLVADAQPLTASVPDQPIGTTPSNFPGLQLRLYVARRLSADAALVVFGVYTEPGVNQNNIDTLSVMNSVSANGYTSQGAAVSSASLVDPVGLKQYLVYMSNPSVDSTCVCSLMPNDQEVFTPGKVSYFAAVTAAPPPGVSSVTFSIGMGSIGPVPLSG